MTDRPILYSAVMARATLRKKDPKTQTRRLRGLEFVNSYTGSLIGECGLGTLGYKGLETSDYYIRDKKDYAKNPGLYHWFFGLAADGRTVNPIPVKCPYGQVGDMLWGRETWAVASEFDQYAPSKLPNRARETIVYRADGENGSITKWRPSIFMLRWASRITHHLTGVRCEQLQDISHADCLAEGVDDFEFGGYDFELKDVHPYSYAKMNYRRLWESINGPGSWDANPYVWALEFKRVTATA